MKARLGTLDRNVRGTVLHTCTAHIRTTSNGVKSEPVSNYLTRDSIGDTESSTEGLVTAHATRRVKLMETIGLMSVANCLPELSLLSNRIGGKSVQIKNYFLVNLMSIIKLR